MTETQTGRVRVLRKDEVDVWCGAPMPPEHERFEAWRDGEREWVEQWKTPCSNLFVFEAPDGDLLGKYDIPVERPSGWTLWAPTVRPGPRAEAVMDALCAHQVAEAGRRGVERVELLLERGHWVHDLAREAILRAGFTFEEGRVVVGLDLEKPLLETPVAIEVRPAAELPEAELRALCHAAGIPDADDEEVAPHAAGMPFGVVAWQDGEPIGLALAGPPSNAETLMDHGIGLVPKARGRGLGKALVRAFLEGARRKGATYYLVSTPVDNAAMRGVFAWLGCEAVSERSVFRL